MQSIELEVPKSLEEEIQNLAASYNFSERLRSEVEYDLIKVVKKLKSLLIQEI